MPRSYHDFGNIESLLAANQVDLAEVFHVLTGVGLLDGLGRTLFFDNFSHGLSGWALGSYGTGVTPYIQIGDILYPADVYVPPVSVFFSGGTVRNDMSYAQRIFYSAEYHKVGLEMGIVIGANICDYQVTINLDRSPENHLLAQLRLYVPDGIFRITTPSGFVDVASFNLPTWNLPIKLPIKLVVDFVTAKYKKLIIADKVYDLSVYD